MRETPVERVAASAYEVPTTSPESDGTYAWDHTVLVVVEVGAAGQTGLGYTYADRSTATLAQSLLGKTVTGIDAMNVGQAYRAMIRAIRNLGRPGIASMAISAVDVALWDLKAKLLGLPLATLLGALREAVPLYASGGFTSYSAAELEAQLGGWAKDGFGRVKMKVGRRPEDDPARVAVARSAIGADVELFVDANGGYGQKRALAMADIFARYNVTWFEEPVSSDDLVGLRLLRDRAPATMDIAAGEYGYDLPYFDRMITAGAVDVVQADATRCGGVTGFLEVAALCEARSMPLSAHCAPTLHAHVGCAAPDLVHVEYFHDHQRIEQLLFDGAPVPIAGTLAPDLARPGLGITLRRGEAERFAVR